MLSRERENPNHFYRIVGNSDAMRQLHECVMTVAPTDASVMLVGETGTGKELVARTIHSLSRRKRSPFVAANCPAMDDNLWQSEMFGHERGAFTSAVSLRKGRFERANTGTFFLTKFRRRLPRCRANY